MSQYWFVLLLLYSAQLAAFPGLGTAAWAAPGSAGTGTYHTEELHFRSGGASIGVDAYVPNATAEAPIIVLHGAGGMLFDGPAMSQMARALAAVGHPVYVVHYFNRTGHLVVRIGTMERSFDVWLATVRDAINWVQQISRAPLGIYGYSLGAFLALAAASGDLRVGAVVEQAGGIWNKNESLIGRLPPVLVIQGLEDRRVPFAKYAEPLVLKLRRQGTSVETHYYLEEAHQFSSVASARAAEQTVEFFGRQLRADPAIKAKDASVSRNVPPVH